MKVAIFTEGQSELIFTRELLLRFIFQYQNISLVCLRLYHSNTHPIPYQIKNPNARYHFQIVDIGNDSKVISHIKETYPLLIASGFDYVICLRDLFSEEYKKVSRRVDGELIRLFIEKQTQTLDEITGGSGQVKLFFAIMEFEAWLLSMPYLFEKLDSILTVEYIEDNLGFNLLLANPQQDFYHPANQMSEIYELIGAKYKKSEDQITAIMATISEDDIADALAEEKCPSFKEYYSEIVALSELGN